MTHSRKSLQSRNIKLMKEMKSIKKEHDRLEKLKMPKTPKRVAERFAKLVKMDTNMINHMRKQLKFERDFCDYKLEESK